MKRRRRDTHTSDAERAIINFTAIRNNPPVSQHQYLITTFTLALDACSEHSRKKNIGGLTPKYHVDVFLLRWTDQRVSPEEVHPLPAMEIE